MELSISTLPDEILATVFEAGSVVEGKQCHFGTLVSHVAHHASLESHRVDSSAVE